jgi:chromosome partitioning protein
MATSPSFFGRLSQWVQPVAGRRPDSTAAPVTGRGRVLAVTAHKGGVGKTTTSVNLAAALVRHLGLKVLLVDLDPQGHVSGSLHAMVNGTGSPLSRVFGGESVTLLDAVSPTQLPGFDVTGWDPQLQQAELKLGSRPGFETLLRQALGPARARYDVIVLDCAPNLGPLTLNALVAADLVLIPCDMSPLAIRGVDSIVQAVHNASEVHNPGLDIAGIVMTRVDSRSHALNQSILATLHAHHGTMILDTQIPILSAYVRAQQAGLDIFGAEPRGKAAEAYLRLAEELRAELAPHATRGITVAAG